MHRLTRLVGSTIIGVATALAIIAIAIPLFLNPAWVAFEQGRAQAAAWTGFDAADLHASTDSILHDLVIGPAAFDVTVAGRPVLDERERQHMRDVRGVFTGFFAVTAALGLAALAIAVWRRRSPSGRSASWSAVRAGAVGLAAGLIVVGAIALVAFDALFEFFHRVLFPGGSYTFDPRTDRLVQLFPFDFWQETAIVLGVVCIVAATVVALIAHRRLGVGHVVSATSMEPGAEPMTVR